MTTAIDEATQLDITELVDMEKEPACEHQAHSTGLYYHSGPAWGIIQRFFRCGCHPNDMILICESAYKNSFLLHCPQCGHTQPRDEGWKLVSVL